MEYSLECSSDPGRRRHIELPSLAFQRTVGLAHSCPGWSLGQTVGLVVGRGEQSLAVGVFSCRQVAEALCSFLAQFGSWFGWRSSEWRIFGLCSLILIYYGLSWVSETFGVGFKASLESNKHQWLDSYDGWSWNLGSDLGSWAHLANKLIESLTTLALVGLLKIQSLSTVAGTCKSFAFEAALGRVSWSLYLFVKVVIIIVAFDCLELGGCAREWYRSFE